MSADVAQVLRDTLKRLDGGKAWCPNGVGTDDVPCIMFALPAASECTMEPYRVLHGVVAADYPDRTRRPDSPLCLGDFNDHPDTTWADVERVFEKAIANADES